MRGLWLIAVLFTLGLALATGQERPKLVFEKGQGGYEIAVLRAALDVTQAEYGPVDLQPLGQPLTENRAIAVLNQGGFDVTYMALTAQRETQVLPIRVDLSRGTQGYRLLLTRQDLAERVARATNLEALRAQFTVGFGAQWADLEIFLDNGFRTVTATEPRFLYPMLENGRFDIFPRGLNEVWRNLDSNRDLAPHVVVAENVAILYPLVNCFVVARGNLTLAARLTLGLDRLLADGTLKRMFTAAYSRDLQRARLDTRTVIVLPNRNLPRGGPAFETSWWLPTK